MEEIRELLQTFPEKQVIGFSLLSSHSQKINPVITPIQAYSPTKTENSLPCDRLNMFDVYDYRLGRLGNETDLIAK